MFKIFLNVKSAKNSLIEVFKTCNLKFLKENGVGKKKFRIIIDNVFLKNVIDGKFYKLYSRSLYLRFY